MSMNNNSNQQNLCKQGCGFYGNAQNMDMCSKCYQNFLKTSNQEEAPHSQSSNQSPYGSQISINEMYQNRSKLVESSIHQCKENNRKRLAQSEIESVNKVPKKCNLNEDSEQYAMGTKQLVDLFAATEETAQPTNIEKLDPDDPGASPVSSIHNGSGNTGAQIMKKPRRCEFCRRKVGLTGFDCRCGGHYCAVHRYSDKHSCTFDYQAHGQEQIKHQNPMICGSKIKKI